MSAKAKTKKIVAKRFKLTKTGKLLHGHQGGRHLRTNKSKKQLRKYRVPGTVSKAMHDNVRKFLPFA